MPLERPFKGNSIKFFPDNYIVADIETTGLSPCACEIIEISAIRVENGEITDTFDTLVKPNCRIPYSITALTGITNDMVKTAPDIAPVMQRFLDFAGSSVIVGHNVSFDVNFLYEKARLIDCYLTNDYFDTLYTARRLIKDTPNHKLGTLCDYFGIINKHAHRALSDVYATNELYKILRRMSEK